MKPSGFGGLVVSMLVSGTRALLPCSLILLLAYKGLEQEKLDKKSPGPPGWGLMQQASPLLIGKR
jgi:hypothetical protein